MTMSASNDKTFHRDFPRVEEGCSSLAGVAWRTGTSADSTCGSASSCPVSMLLEGLRGLKVSDLSLVTIGRLSGRARKCLDGSQPRCAIGLHFQAHACQ